MRRKRGLQSTRGILKSEEEGRSYMITVAISGKEEQEGRRRRRRLKHLSSLNESVARRHPSSARGNDAFSKDITFGKAARDSRSTVFQRSVEECFHHGRRGAPTPPRSSASARANRGEIENITESWCCTCILLNPVKG